MDGNGRRYVIESRRWENIAKGVFEMGQDVMQ